MRLDAEGAVVCPEFMRLASPLARVRSEARREWDDHLAYVTIVPALIAARIWGLS